jgi:hypothetical protein
VTHPDVMLILYRGLIRPVLEYGCYAQVEVGKDSICLRIALGLRLEVARGYWWSTTAEVEVFDAES